MRLLHTMLRVGDLQRSIDFYTKVLGMKLLRTSENPNQILTGVCWLRPGNRRSGDSTDLQLGRGWIRTRHCLWSHRA